MQGDNSGNFKLGKPIIFYSHSVLIFTKLDAVWLVCLQSFQRIFGREFLECFNTTDLAPSSEEGPAASESTSIVQEARGTLFIELKLFLVLRSCPY